MPEEYEAKQYFSDYNFCKHFGWTPDQLAEISEDYYNHFAMIMNASGAKDEADRIRQGERLKRNQSKNGR